MTPEQRIDANLDAVLRAAGSALQHYTMPSTRAELRRVMRKIMSDSYLAGSNDCHRALLGDVVQVPADLIGGAA